MKIKILFQIGFWILFLGISPSSFAQINEEFRCGYEPTEEDLQQMAELDKYPDIRLQSVRETKWIPVQIHIVKGDNGVGDGNLTKSLAEIDKLNQGFYPHVQFYVCEKEVFNKNEDVFNGSTKTIKKLTDKWDTWGVLNIYFINTLEDSKGKGLGGAYVGGDKVFFCNSMFGTTAMIHELGHYFSLVHTHGPCNFCTDSKELVDGSNCKDEGDKICDTNADPNLSGLVDKNCNYTGTAKDDNRDKYKPPVSNYMNYGRDKCKTRFSTKQLEKMLKNVKQFKKHLKCDDCGNGELLITKDITTNKTHKIGGLIEASVTVSGTKNVKFQAGNEIRLKSGFNVKNNRGYFSARVAPCHVTPRLNLIKKKKEQTSILSVSNVDIYPNPSPGKFTVRFNNPEGQYSIEVFNTLGKKVYFKENANQETKINLGRVKQGLYLIKIIKENEVVTSPIFIEN